MHKQKCGYKKTFNMGEKMSVKLFTRKVWIIVVISMVLGNLLTVYSVSQKDYFGFNKIEIIGIILFGDLIMIAICLAAIYYLKLPEKGAEK